jgi:cytochrome c553
MIRPLRCVFFIAVASALTCATALAVDPPHFPAWAYPMASGSPRDGASGGARQVPDSAVTFTEAEVSDPYFAPDWHPADHAAMPEIIARGRKPGVMACGYCHRADGSGGPENANLAGLPVAYIVQQLADFKSGARATSVPNRVPTAWMIAVGKAADDAEVKAAAAYFSALKPRANIRVVESATAPKTHAPGWFLAATQNAEREPIGVRIIEVPENLEQFESRDARARFIAYVPPGSITRGKELVGKGTRDGVSCAICHGSKLTGLDRAPPIAGRSPSYIARQLYDFKSGARAGIQGVPMREIVAGLTPEDIVAVAAYLASLPP